MKRGKRPIIWAAVILIVIVAAYSLINYVCYGMYRTHLINGDFSMHKFGWMGTLGEVYRDGDNKFIKNGYNWGLYQNLSVEPGGSYSISADTQKGTAESAARLAAVFYNSNNPDQPVCYYINYWHRTANKWESIPTQVVNAPADADRVRIYLLALGEEEGYHFFDNVVLIRNKRPLPPAEKEVHINQPGENTGPYRFGPGEDF